MRLESWRRGAIVVAIAAVCAVAQLLGACAAGPTDTTGSNNNSGGGDGGAVTSGGNGGNGGSGGQSSPCGQDCSAIATPVCYVSVCNEGMHPGPIGACVVVADVDGVACDDGQFCSTADSCIGGVCTGGPANDCGVVPAACEQVVCDEPSDSCSTSPFADGMACQSPDLCLVGTTCSNGLCVGGTSNDCFFEPVPDDCHVSECNPTTGMCEPVIGNEGGPCTDVADLCTTGKTCTAGVCGGGMAVNCSQLTMGCNLGVCDTTNGQCTTMAVMNGQLCDDLDACTTGELCTNQVCGGGAPVTTCSQTQDGCCPMSCTAINDIDCACTTGALSTPFNTNNGQSGNMFDVTAIGNIEVQTVDVNITGTNTVAVYYRPGSYVGFEGNAAGWTLVASAVTPSLGTNVPSPVPAQLNIMIPAGQTYGFYVTTVLGSMNYTDGTSVGAIAASNADLQIKQGAGVAYPFAGTFTPRVWNGVIHYEKCGN